MTVAMKRSADNPLNKEYLKTKVMTASPEQLQLMLYDGAIRFCEQARAAIENREIEKSYNLIMRAENIVMELYNAMRNDVAPEICENMRRLYMFCYNRLIEANMQRALPPLDDAMRILRHMRESWILVMEKLHQEKSPSADKSSSSPSPRAAQPSPHEPAELQLGAMINFQG
jgi:flagellar secretion chaperone FliS